MTNTIKLSLIALLAGTLASQAATDTWSGGSSVNWNDAGNWNTLPTDGDSLIFTTANNTANNNDFPTNTGFGGITFDASAGTFSLGGNAINFSGTVENDTPSVLQTINLAMVLTNNATFNTVSNLDTTVGDIEVDGAVSGTGSLTKNGGGTLTLSSKSYSGGTIVNNGFLVVSNDNGSYTMNGGSLLLNFRTYYSGLWISQTADSAVGITLLDNIEPRGIDLAGNIGSPGYKLTKIGEGIMRIVQTGVINAGSVDVAAGTLASLGGGAGGAVGVEPLTKWGTAPITVENGAMLRADDGGVCPNAITLNGGDGTSTGDYTHLGALISSARNNGGSTTNFNIFTNTITLAADSTIGSYYNKMIISGNIVGSGSLTKAGNSPLFLSGSNSYSGYSTTINAGVVQLGSSYALSSASTVVWINNASTLDLNGTNVYINVLGGDNSGLGTVDNTSGTAASLSLNNAAYVGMIKNTGGGALSITNLTGTSSLLGVNSYTGANIVQGGTLEINIPIGTTTGGLVQIADSATLTLHKTTPGSSLKAAGATIGTSGATTLNIDLNNYGNPSAAIINATNGTGVLNANGTLTVNFLNTANLSVGTFPIIRYTTRSGTGNFTLTPISGITAKIVTNTAAGNNYIGLQITGAPVTTWKGTTNNLWDTTTTNWTYSGSPVLYSDGSAVYFDDTALTNNVNLTTALSPGTVLINSSSNYIFGGTGPLSGGTLTKNGSGTLILDVSGNTYASTTIGAGTLQVGNNDNKGDLGSGAVDDESILSFNRTNNLTVANAISGAGSVVQNNTNTVKLSVANTYTGGTTINKGILQLGANNALGLPGTGITGLTVAANAALDLNGYQQSTTNAVVVSGSGISSTFGAIGTSSGYMNVGSGHIGVNNVVLAADAAIGSDAGNAMEIGNAGLGISGNNHLLTKVGGNYLIIEKAAVNSPSAVIINGGGILFYQNNSPLGTAPITISNNCFVDTWDNNNHGLTIPNNFIISSTGGRVNDNWGQYYAHPNWDTYNGSFTLNGPMTTYCCQYYTGAGQPAGNTVTMGTMTFNGAFTGPGSFTIIATNIYGGSTITLNGANTYTGPTTIVSATGASGGKLAISAISQGGGAYTNQDGGTLDVPAQTGGYTTVPMSTLALGSTNGATLSFSRLILLSTTNAPVTATNLVLTGTNSILAPGSAFATAGQYPLIKYTTLSGSIANLALGAAGSRGAPGYLSNNVANSSIDLVVPGGNPVNWVGNVNNTWDINTTANWLYLAASTTYLQSGSLGDAVTFDDSSTKTNVTLAVPLSPSLVLVNTTNNYTFIGSNLVGASVLVKNGTGTLTLSNQNNTMTGGTFVNAGTLKLATSLSPAIALNNLNGTLTVAPGATFDMGSNNPTAMIINASGAGVGGNGAIQANYSGNGAAYGPSIINQTGNLTVGGNNRWDLRNGSKQWNVSSNGSTLTKVGSGYVGLVGATVSTNLGDIRILNGTLDFQTTTTGEGNTNYTIFVGNGGNLGMYQLATPITKSLIFSNGSGIVVDGGNTLGQNVIAGPMTLDSGTMTIKGNFYNGVYFSNNISGAGSLALQFQSYVYLAASNSFTGTITVPNANASNGGLGTRLSFIGNGSATKVSQIIMQGIVSGQAYAGWIDVLGRPDATLTLATNQLLRGDNGSYVRGSVVAQAGSAIAPGGINNSNYQYMTVGTSLTFQAGSTNYMDIYKSGSFRTNDVIIVSNLVTYAGTLQMRTNGLSAIIAGDTFKLFNAGSVSGNFNTIADNSGATWSFNPATGIATVLTPPPTVVTTPTNITATVSGNLLTLAWPADHLGWSLQIQTNTLSVGLVTNATSWVTLPGSSSVTSTNMTIDPANGTVFYRMVYP